MGELMVTRRAKDTVLCLLEARKCNRQLLFLVHSLWVEYRLPRRKQNKAGISSWILWRFRRARRVVVGSFLSKKNNDVASDLYALCLVWLIQYALYASRFIFSQRGEFCNSLSYHLALRVPGKSPLLFFPSLPFPSHFHFPFVPPPPE